MTVSGTYGAGAYGTGTYGDLAVGWLPSTDVRWPQVDGGRWVSSTDDRWAVSAEA